MLNWLALHQRRIFIYTGQAASKHIAGMIRQP